MLHIVFVVGCHSGPLQFFSLYLLNWFLEREHQAVFPSVFFSCQITCTPFGSRLLTFPNLCDYLDSLPRVLLNTFG